MYIRDNDGKIVDSEFSLGTIRGTPCVIVESSGGSNPKAGVKRCNPEYNKFLNILFQRIGNAGAQITQILLDSSKVS